MFEGGGPEASDFNQMELDILKTEKGVLSRVEEVIDEMKERDLGQTDRNPHRDSVVRSSDDKQIKDLYSEVINAMKEIEDVQIERVKVEDQRPSVIRKSLEVEESDKLQAQINEINAKQDEMAKKEENNYVDIWEPKKMKDKCTTFLHNTLEMWVVLIISLMSVTFSSLISAILFMSSCLLFLGMVKPQTQRYKFNIMVTIFNMLLWAFFLAIKVLYILNLPKDKTMANYQDFEDRIIFNDLLGVKSSFNDNKNDIAEYKEQQEKTGAPSYSYEVYDTKSYIYDLVIFIVLSITLKMLVTRKKTITNLILPSQRGLSDAALKTMVTTHNAKRAKRNQVLGQKDLLEKSSIQSSDIGENIDIEEVKKELDAYHVKDIKEMIRLENPDKEASKQQQDDDASKDVDIGTARLSRGQNLVVTETQQQEKYEKAYLSILQKEYTKNWVGNDTFYKFNQKFFMLTLLFQIMEAMAFPAVSELPTLAFIVLMLSFYAIRKQAFIASAYRRFVFFLMYWMQMNLTVKLVVRIITNITYVKNRAQGIEDLGEQANGYDSVQAVKTLWGDFNLKLEDQQSTRSYICEIVNICLCIFCIQGWKTCKWFEIRYKTQHMEENVCFYNRMEEYFAQRQSVDSSVYNLTAILQSGNEQLKQQLEEIHKKKEQVKQITQYEKLFGQQKGDKKKSKGRFDTQLDGFTMSRYDKTQYIPTLVIWFTRINMIWIVYMYHCPHSLIHLIWIALSFILDYKMVLLMSNVAFNPLIMLEFCMIYGNKISSMRNTRFFQSYGQYFHLEHKHDILERTYLFIVLLVFSMMLSSFVLVYKSQDKEKIQRFFTKRIRDAKYSSAWKFIFYFLKYIHIFALLVLFINGIKKLNNFKNLGFMLFFCFYAAYENLYRYSSVVLIIFISIFIVGQYYFSLFYQISIYNADDEVSNRYETMKTLSWLDMVPYQNNLWDPYGINDVSDFYFRLFPSIFDWFILIMVGLIVEMNTLFRDTHKANRMVEEATNGMADDFKRTAYYLGRTKRIFKGVFIYCIIITMCIIQINMQTNLINWLFFIVNITNVVIMIIGVQSQDSFKRSERIATFIKVFSIVVIVIDIFFICFIGEFPKDTKPHSIDQKFKRAYPSFYNNLDIIGFRSLDVNDKEDFSRKFATYVGYFLLSIYLEMHFKKLQTSSEGEEHFTDKQFKKLFDFQRDKKSVDLTGSEIISKFVTKGKILLKSNETSKDQMYLGQLIEEKEKEGEENDTIFQIKKQYKQEDLINIYEGIRFTLPFMVYRAIDFWPVMDFICIYGHFVNNIIIIMIAIYYNVNFVMFINLVCMCAFYLVTTIQINNISNRLAVETGIQSQCDLRIASMITKKYNQQTFNKFITLRNTIWKFQFGFNIAMFMIGYPTSLLEELKDKNTFDDRFAQKIDDCSFWLFFLGLYKDKENVFYFFQTFTWLILGSIFEKQAINWLSNRYGCTYFRLQKYIELDMRREALREKNQWKPAEPPIKYDIDRYQKHYFYSDFDFLKTRFENAHCPEHENDQFCNFIPHKIAVRIRDTITFSVKLDLGAPGLPGDGEDSLTQQLIRKGDEEYDYESVPVLREFKIEALRKIVKSNIQRKYKISFSKGMQMFVEAFILCLLMISLMVKANFVSVILLVFIFRFAFSNTKSEVLVRANTYFCFLFMGMYFVYLMNLTAKSQIQEFPPGLKNYPVMEIVGQKNKYHHIGYEWQQVGFIPKDIDSERLDQITDWTSGNKDEGEKSKQQIRNYPEGKKVLGHDQFLPSYTYGNNPTDDQIWAKPFDKSTFTHFIVESGNQKHYKLYTQKEFLDIYASKKEEEFLENHTKNIDNGGAKVFTADFSEDNIWLQKFEHLGTFDKFKIVCQDTHTDEHTYCKKKLEFTKEEFEAFWKNTKKKNRLIQALNHSADGAEIRVGQEWPRYAVPWFFHWTYFSEYNLKLAYLVGVGIDQSQLSSMIIDFIIIYCVSMYILYFRNPVIMKRVQKIFWQFPSLENLEQWNRIEPLPRKQVLWLYESLEESSYEKFRERQINEEQTQNGTTDENLKEWNEMTQEEKDLAEIQHKFAEEYNDKRQINLTNILTNYVDLSSSIIWSDQTLKDKKWEIKDNSIYFRTVKQGSMLVYLTGHIFSIFVLLTSSILKKSWLSLAYVVILLPKLLSRTGVLEQREINQFKKKDKLENEVSDLTIEKRERLESLQAELKKPVSDQNQMTIVQIRAKIKIIESQFEMKREQVNKIKKSGSYKQFAGDKEKVEEEWSMIYTFQKYLLYYALFDFTLQLIYQMPIFEPETDWKNVGLLKIWSIDHAKSYGSNSDLPALSIHYFENSILNKEYFNKAGLQFQHENFYKIVMNCVIIAMIFFQSDVFNSFGYQKFVTQSDGSLDLLVQLSDLKAKSKTYIFNNVKIRTILQMQRRKASILKVVDVLKEKILRWRKFTKTTLVNAMSTDSQRLQAEDKTRKQEKKIQKVMDKIEKKNVGFAKDEEDCDEPYDQKSEGSEEDKEDEELFFIPEAQKVRLSPVQSERIFKNLAKEFVKSKKKKLRYCIRKYNQWNNKYTEKILFKNKPKDLKELKNSHAQGEVDIPTELEKIMLVEAEEIIKRQYDDLKGSKEISLLINKRNSKKSLLEQTGIDKKIRLKDMKKTWEFTRNSSMFFRYLECLFYVIISCTDTLTYCAMVYSMYTNGGLVTFFYPVAVFGYALMYEVRPSYKFWNVVMIYSICILLFKFLCSIEDFNNYLDSHMYYIELFKIGIVDHSSTGELLGYIMPELLIICFIMLNEIKLKLLGLYWETELEIESVNEGIDRTIASGDEEKVKRNKNEAQNMNLGRFYESIKEQVKREKEYEALSKEEYKANFFAMSPKEKSETVKTLKIENPNAYADVMFLKENRYKNVEGGYEMILDMKESERNKLEVDINIEMQLQNLRNISGKIWKTSREFDLDVGIKDSKWDKLVTSNILQKSLINDSLIYVEGDQYDSPDILSKQQFIDEAKLKPNWDQISCGEEEHTFNEKLNTIDLRKKPKMTMFDSSPFLQKIFPALRIQKPGYDVYARTTLILIGVLLYIFLFFSKFTVSTINAVSLTSWASGQSEIFKSEMAFLLMIILIIIVIERYSSRTDTKEVIVKRKKYVPGSEKSNREDFFTQDEIFAKTNTVRLMTVKLKTMKTGDLDLGSSSVQNYLSSLQGTDASSSLTTDNDRIYVTKQQKCKFYLHWIVLIISHFYVFWYVPVHGNFQLYKTPVCDQTVRKYYDCQDFRYNMFLRGFYILILLYLLFSAQQLSYGFSIIKIPSSLFTFHGDSTGLYKMACPDIYMKLPFLTEMRVILDFCFSHTAMDIWQYFQLFRYNYELYAACVSNSWYNEKVLGVPVTTQDRCDGCCLLWIVLGALILPFFLFSEAAPGLTQDNPVRDAALDFQFIIDKKVFIDLDSFDVNPNIDKIRDKETYERILHSYVERYCQEIRGTEEQKESTPECMDRVTNEMLNRKSHYPFYNNEHMFLNMYDQASYDDKSNPYKDMTETSQFNIGQYQSAMATKYSDKKSSFSEIVMDQLYTDMRKAIYFEEEKSPEADMYINIHMKISRDLPLTAKTIDYQDMRQLNFTRLPDCLAGKKLIPTEDRDTQPLAGFFNIKRQCDNRKKQHKERCNKECNDEAIKCKEQCNSGDSDCNQKCEQQKTGECFAACEAKEKRHVEGLMDYFLIKQAYNPALMLGQSTNALSITQASQSKMDQLKDLLITIDCDYTYHIMARHLQTDYNYFSYLVNDVNYLEKALEVNPTTCTPIYNLDRWLEVFHIPAGYNIIEPSKLFDGTQSYDEDGFVGKKFDFVTLQPNEKKEIEIRVTNTKEDYVGDFDLCKSDDPSSDEYSIQKLNNLISTKTSLVEFIVKQQKYCLTQHGSDQIKIFITNPNSDVKKEFMQVEADLSEKLQKELTLIDIETKKEFKPKSLIEGMKAVRQDILDDYGIKLGEDVNDVYMDTSRIDAVNKQFEKEMAKDETNWIRFRMIFINLRVSNSFLASYSMKGLYMLIILGISSFLKPICIFLTFQGWLYEATHTMVFLKLIDAIYMGRHEKNLKMEEESWRMLQDIVRCPELFKAITGSNAKGSIDPLLDNLSEEAKTKLAHLEKLEQKGFEVQDLKRNIMENVKYAKEDIDPRFPPVYEEYKQ